MGYYCCLRCGNAVSYPTAITTQFAPAEQNFKASFLCGDGNTPVQNAVCGNQQLATLDLRMAAVYRAELGAADVFERDQLLAAQRAWLVSLPARCGLNDEPMIPASAAADSCLAKSYRAQIALLTNWAETGSQAGRSAKAGDGAICQLPAFCLQGA